MTIPVKALRRWLPGRRDQGRHDAAQDRRGPSRDRVFRLRGMETLEDRTLMSTFQDLGNLRVVADSFVQMSSTFSATGTIQVGFVPAHQADFTPLVDIDGSVSFVTGTSDPILNLNGEVDALAKGLMSPVALGSGMRSWDVHDLVSTGVAFPSGDVVGVAETNFTPDLIAFEDPGTNDTADSRVHLQGAIAIPGLGALSISVAGANFVEIAPSGVVLSATDLSSPGTFDFEGVSFGAPGGLGVVYSGDGTFSLSGSLKARASGGDVILSGALGTSTTPGLVIQDGKLKSLDVTIGADFTVVGASVAASGLDFIYSKPDDAFEIAAGGSVSLAAGDVTIAGTFGDTSSDTPGLAIQGGKLEGLDVAGE